MSLLSQLARAAYIDVDDADIDVVKSVPCQVHNVTSNQAIATRTLLLHKNRSVLEETVRLHGHEGWESVYTNTLLVLLAKIVPLIKGRVLVQITPRIAHDREAILRQCRHFDEGFQRLGVPRTRYGIKIPFSGARAAAAATLNAEGIRVLATAVFCVEQAVAASQASCFAISPYFNEIAAYSDASKWPDVADPALAHPMSSRVLQIMNLFGHRERTCGQVQPVMVIASHSNTSEVLAMAELRCSHTTISAHNLEALQHLPGNDSWPLVKSSGRAYGDFEVPVRLAKLLEFDPFTGAIGDRTLTWFQNDFLSEGERVLDTAMQADAIAQIRFDDAIAFFSRHEEIARAVIEEAIAGLV